jgi:hypothetical protein
MAMYEVVRYGRGVTFSVTTLDERFLAEHLERLRALRTADSR